MNLLAIRLFVNKYYDLVFLFFFVLLFGVIYLFNKKAFWVNLLDNKLRRILAFIKTKKGEFLLLSLILLGGLILRLYKIDNPVADWHSFRQADTASVSRIYLKERINLLYPRYHDVSTTQSGLENMEGYRFVEFPILNAIHAISANIYPRISLEIWGRLLSILAALITAYTIFLIGKKYLGGMGGLLSAFFYLFIPFNIYFTRVILPEPAAVMFSVLALWLFIRYVENDNYKYLMMTAFSFSLALLIKPYAIFYSIPMVFLAEGKWGYKHILKRYELLVAGLITLAPFLCWRMWESQFPEGIPFWKWAFNGDGIRFRPAFWYWIFGERLGKLILGVWGLVPFSVGLISYKKRSELLHYLAMGMLVYLAVVATANVKHDYYQTLIIPSVALMSAWGTTVLWNTKAFNRTASRILATFSILAMLVIGAFQVKEFYKINRPEIIRAGKAVEKVTSTDALIIAPYNGDTAFLYQTNRRGWPVVDRPINELIEKGAQYYVSVDLNHPQTLQYMEDYKVIEITDSYVIIKLIRS